MTTSMLKRFFDFLEIDFERGQKPQSEATVLAALFRHVFQGRLTDDIVSAALTARSSSLRCEQELDKARAAAQADRDTMLLEEEDDDVEEGGAHRQYEQAARHVAQRRQAEDNLKDLVKAMIRKPEQEIANPAASSSSGGAAASSSHRQRAILPKPDGWSRQEALPLCPPGVNIFKDEKDHRWRITGDYLAGFQKSRAWGDYTADTDFSAMIFVLQIAWSAWQKRGGGPRPWDVAA